MEAEEYYLHRKTDDFLLDWKNSKDKYPLIIKGARQIGKTKTILRFAASYESCVYINFVTDEKFRKITKDGYEPDSVIKNITLLDSDKKFIPGKTLIVFDELQEFPEIATSLKFFKIQNQYDVICSGSLLGINYKHIESNSVGYKEEYEMTSLDFEEFLWAKGIGQERIDEMLEHMKSLKPFSELEMQVYSSYFKDFCITGGMPAIVKSYILNGNFEGILHRQKTLVSDYKQDVRKYAVGIEQTRILSVLEHIPVQLSKENKKFQISKVAKGARYKDYWGCVEWLRDAGIIKVAFCMNFPELPLKGNYDDSKYKIYFFDTGLLIACLDEESQEDLRANDNFGVFKGALYENIIGESLKKQGYDLFYYKKEDSTLEEDFFIRTKKTLLPLEVKATNGTAKSLRMLVQGEHYPDITNGIKFISGNIGFANGIFTFPYFCSFLLKRYLKDVAY